MGMSRGVRLRSLRALTLPTSQNATGTAATHARCGAGSSKNGADITTSSQCHRQAASATTESALGATRKRHLPSGARGPRKHKNQSQVVLVPAGSHGQRHYLPWSLSTTANVLATISRSSTGPWRLM